MLSSPINPALEMLYGHLVAIHNLALEVSVDFVEIESVLTWDKAFGFENIGAELIYAACRTWVVTCRLDST